jgi:hypothetical protein
MKRLPWIVVGLAALALLAFLFWYTPERRAASALSVPVAAEPAASGSSAPGPSAAPRSANAPRTAQAGTPAAVIDAGPPDPGGPVTVELGNHTIYLNDPVERRVMRFTLRLTVGNGVAAREARLRREELVRMAFFLGSHRVAEGALGQEGRDRFANDLLDRYRNVIRSGTLDALELADYEVIPSSKLPPKPPR